MKTSQTVRGHYKFLKSMLFICLEYNIQIMSNFIL